MCKGQTIKTIKNHLVDNTDKMVFNGFNGLSE